MEVEVTKENLCINRIVGKKVETIIVEGDVIVPDIKPDILSAINTTGNVCVYKKEVLDGKVRLDGNINVYIMYLADSPKDNIRGVNSSIDFMQIIDIENCMSDMDLDENVSVKSVECKILNGRKINIKATLEVKVVVYSNENIEMISKVNNVDDICTLNSSFKVNDLLGRGETRLVAKENVMLDEGSMIAEILNANTEIINKEYKVSYNKVLTKADLFVKVLFLTEDNQVKTSETRVPVIGFIDMPNVSEKNLCDTNYQLKNVIIKPNANSENSIGIDAEVGVSCKAYDDHEVDVIQDLYSASKKVDYTSKKFGTMTCKNNVNGRCNVKEKVAIPELGENELYSVSISPSITNKMILNNKITYQGELDLIFIFEMGSMNRISTMAYKTGFDVSIDIPNINSNFETNESIEIVSSDFVVGINGSVDMNVILNMNVSVFKTEEITVIDDVKIEEENDENPYSMVVYFVKAGDTLWNIAKKFKSTIEDISRVNNIENENKINIGQQLFIPKYVKRGEVYG